MDPYATAPWRRPNTGNSSPTPYPGSSSPSLCSTTSPFSASPTCFSPTSPPPFNGTPVGFMSPRVTSPMVPSPLTFAPKPPSPNPPSPNHHYSPLSTPAEQSPRNSITSSSVDGFPNFAAPSPLSSPPTEGGPTGLPTPPPPPPPPPPLPNAGDAVPWRMKQPVMELEDIDYNTPIVNHNQNQNQHQNQNHNINQPSRRTSGGQVQQYDHLPAALQSTLMKDKKPFTYTPGGIDLSEIRSPRMAKRLHYNQRDPPGNLARINIPPPDPDAVSKVTSPPPPETYPQPRVQILPQPQAKMQVLPQAPQPPPPPPLNTVPKPYCGGSQRVPLPPPQKQQQQQQQQPKQQLQQQSPVEQPKSQDRIQSHVHAQYNSPMNLYSADNVVQAYQDQTGDVLPEYENLSVNAQPNRPREEDGFVPYYKEQRPQSRSFRLLQVMTDTTAGEAEGNTEEEAQRPSAKQPEDEMRFTGVRRNPIPSRAFQTLQRMTGDDLPQQQQPPQHQPFIIPVQVENHQPASESNAGECELRYRGAYIPSRSFRLLQEMTGGSDDDAPSPSSTLPRPAKKMTSVNMQVMGNGPSSVQALDLNSNPGPFVPPSQQKAEVDPKKYTGGHIPSRSFRMLQAMTGGADDDDINGTSAPVNNIAPTIDSQAPEAEPRMYMGGNIPSRSFRLLQAMTDPDGPIQLGGGTYPKYAITGQASFKLTSSRFEEEIQIFKS